MLKYNHAYIEFIIKTIFTAINTFQWSNSWVHYRKFKQEGLVKQRNIETNKCAMISIKRENQRHDEVSIRTWQYQSSLAVNSLQYSY